MASTFGGREQEETKGFARDGVCTAADLDSVGKTGIPQRDAFVVQEDDEVAVLEQGGAVDVFVQFRLALPDQKLSAVLPNNAFVGVGA
jgi:hypothetical protein